MTKVYNKEAIKLIVHQSDQMKKVIKWLKMPISGHPVVHHQSVDLTVKSYLIRQMLELAGQTV